MRGKATLLVLALAGFTPGCALIQDGLHNIFTDAYDCVDDAREYARNRRWAKGAWAQVCADMPDGFSKEYAQGFQDGFAEYLYSGKPEPPPVAPKRFRTLTYQTPAGYHAIQEWFAGYRQGVSVAAAGGYRRFVTAPVAVPSPPQPPPVPPVLPPPAGPPMEVLPAPRSVGPGTKLQPQVAPAGPPPDALPQGTAVPPQETVVPRPQEVVVPPQPIRPLEHEITTPEEAIPTPPKPSERYMPPAQDAVLPPQQARPIEHAAEPPRAILLPPGRNTVRDWAMPQARFGIPRTMWLPRRGLLGSFLPPLVLPEEDDADFEEQEPVLGLPQPRPNE